MSPSRCGPVILLALLLLAPAGRAQEPEVEGVPLSDWLQLVKDEDAKTREAAVTALGLIGPKKSPQVFPALRKALKSDASPAVRRRAAIAVAEAAADEREAVVALADAVRQDADAAVRETAARRLGTVGAAAKPAVPVLVAALKDANAGVRAGAAEALGRLGDDAAAAVPALVQALADADVAVRTEVVSALGRFRAAADAAVPALARAVEQDAVVQVRKEAARSLGRLGPAAGPAAAQALARALAAEKNREATDLRQQAAL